MVFRVFFFGCLTPEDGVGMLFRNVGNQLPTCAVQHPRRAKTPATPRRRTEVAPKFVDWEGRTKFLNYGLSDRGFKRSCILRDILFAAAAAAASISTLALGPAAYILWLSVPPSLWLQQLDHEVGIHRSSVPMSEYVDIVSVSPILHHLNGQW